eukprot:m.133484 g.133484  ORF g.133484 m.133484 type:complete len:464 (+) comp14832_c0_seq1:121-1512(+)
MFLSRVVRVGSSLRPRPPLLAPLLTTPTRQIHATARQLASADSETENTAQWLLPDVSQSRSIGEVLKDRYIETTNDSQATIEGLVASGAELQAEMMFTKRRAEGEMMHLQTYNSLIRAFANKDQGLKVHVLMNWLKSDGLMPDIITYASAILVSAKRQQYDRIKAMLAEMESAGLPPEVLLAHGRLSHDQITAVIHGVRYIIPDFAQDYLDKTRDVSLAPADSPVLKQLIEQWRRETRITVQVDFVLSKSQMEKLESAKTKVIKVGMVNVSAFGPFLPDVTAFLEELRKTSNEDHHLIMFSCLTPAELAEVALSQLEFYSVGNEFGMRVSSLTGEIGRAACKRHFVKRNSQEGIPKEYLELYPTYVERVSKSTQPASQIWADLLSGFRERHGYAVSDNFASTIWSANVIYKSCNPRNSVQSCPTQRTWPFITRMSLRARSALVLSAITINSTLHSSSPQSAAR